MLTEAKTRKAKAADRPYKLTDGGGLHVYVTSAGGKLWRLPQANFRKTVERRHTGLSPSKTRPRSAARPSRRTLLAQQGRRRLVDSERRDRHIGGSRADCPSRVYLGGGGRSTELS